MNAEHSVERSVATVGVGAIQLGIKCGCAGRGRRGTILAHRVIQIIVVDEVSLECQGVDIVRIGDLLENVVEEVPCGR